MTRFPLALCLAVMAGCESNSSNSENEDITTNLQDEFSATLRSVAPYGWAGDHQIKMIEPEEENILWCAASASCEASLVEVGNFKIWISGDTFECAPQIQLVDETDNGDTVDVSDAWLAEGICGLAPEGDYDGWNVLTDIADQVWIHIDSYMAVVTKDTFFYEDDEYLLEGTIADDLSSIDYHLEWGDEQVEDRTINLED